MSLITLFEFNCNVSGVSSIIVSLSVKLQIQLLPRDGEHESEAAHARLTRSLLPGRPKELGKY